jgi:uncharacterized protein YcsI (UPF0317 family)
MSVLLSSKMTLRLTTTDKTLEHVVEKKAHQHLDLITAGEKGKTDGLKVERRAEKDTEDFAFYEITLNGKLNDEEISISETYFGDVSFLPKKITLFEDQNMLYETNMYCSSPYPISSQESLFYTAQNPINFSGEGHFTGDFHVKIFDWFLKKK